MMAACDATSAAKRRRERRLRAMLRHERQSIVMALAEAHHHSVPKVGAVPHVAPRSQKTAGAAGARTGVLEEPAPPLVEVRVAGPRTCVAPSLALGQLAVDELVDSSALAFLLRCSLEAQKSEEKRRNREEEEKERRRKQEEAEYERRMQVLSRRVRDDIPLSAAEYAAWRRVDGRAFLHCRKREGRGRR